MKRGLGNSTAALSTLLFAATMVLWMRSYWVPENIGWVRESLPEQATLQSVSVCITPMDGKLTFDYTRSEQRVTAEDVARLHTGSRFVWRRVSSGPWMVVPTTNWLGFGWMRHDGIFGNDIQYGWQWTAPGWLVAMVFAVPPVMW